MAIDATGAPTSLGIPKFNTSVDAPSGNGSNAQMDAIDALIAARVSAPAAIAAGEVPVWNGAAWVRSSVTNIGPASLGSGVPDATKFLRGDGAWVAPSGAMVQLFDSTLGVAAASFDVPGISQAYNHLKIVVQARGDTVANTVDVNVRLNNDSGGNYATAYSRFVETARADGVQRAATAAFVASIAAASAGAGEAGIMELTIPNYTGTTFRKQIKAIGGYIGIATTSSAVVDTVSSWLNTAAITRFTLLPGSGNFVAGSRLTIYGLL